VIAIENVRLFDEVQARTRELSESLEQQTATSEVLKVISSTPGDLEPVFKAILENATRICGAKFGVLWLCKNGEFRVAPTHRIPTPPSAPGATRPPLRPRAASSPPRAPQPPARRFISQICAGPPGPSPVNRLLLPVGSSAKFARPSLSPF